VDTEICVAALAKVKQFASWTLIDPQEDGEGMCDNRRQRVVSQARANRGTVKIRDAGKLVVQELSKALYVGYLRSEELLVLQLGNRCQRGHQDYMRDTNVARGRTIAQRGSFALRRGGIYSCLALAMSR
jgi:hypothetical protein